MSKFSLSKRSVFVSPLFGVLMVGIGLGAITSARGQSNFEKNNAGSIVTIRKKTPPKVETKPSVVKTPRAKGSNGFGGGIPPRRKPVASTPPVRTTIRRNAGRNDPNNAALANGNDISKTSGKDKNGSATKNVAKGVLQSISVRTGRTGLEVLLNRKSVGKTGADGTLSLGVENGSYVLTVYQGNVEVLPPTNIVIKPFDQKNFDFSTQISRNLRPTGQVENTSQVKIEKVGENTPQVPVDSSTTTKPTQGTVVSEVDVDTILERYSDPRTTNAVSNQDWQSVYKTAQAKLVEGVDAVEIRYLMSLSEGYLTLKEANYMAAINLLESATRQLPQHPLGHYLLGEALQQTGDINGALASYQKSVQANSSFALGYHRLGDLYLRQNKPREAATNFENAVAKGDDTPLVRMKLAQVKIKNKNCSGAIVDLEALSEIAPDGEIYGLLGDCYITEKRDSAAGGAYTKSLELERNALIAYKLGMVSVRLKEYEKARKAFAEALESDPEGKLINAKEARNQIEKLDKRLR